VDLNIFIVPRFGSTFLKGRFGSTQPLKEVEPKFSIAPLFGSTFLKGGKGGF